MSTIAAWRCPLATTVTVVGSGSGQPGWAEFCRSEGLTALWDHDLLQLMAHSPDPFSPTFTAAVRHHDEIVGVFVGSFRGVRPHAAPGRFGPLLADMRIPGQAHAPSWHLRRDLDPARRRSVVRAFERGLVGALGRTRLVGVAYRNATADTAPPVRRTGAVDRTADGPGTMLRLPDSFDAYLAGLSKKRRKSLRRLGPRIEEQTRIEFATKRTDLDPREVAELYRSVAARHPALKVDPRPRVPAEYFRALLDREDVRTISYHVGDRLMAFGTYLRHPVDPWGAYWGMVHPDDGGVPHLYFDHFVRYIRYAIEEEGARTLTSGRGLLEEKQSIGFELMPLYFVGVTRPFLG